MRDGKVMFNIDHGERGCFTAVAPEDMTIKQLLEQSKRIKGTYGDSPAIYSVDWEYEIPSIIFTYNDVKLTPYEKGYGQWTIKSKGERE